MEIYKFFMSDIPDLTNHSNTLPFFSPPRPHPLLTHECDSLLLMMEFCLKIEILGLKLIQLSDRFWKGQ
jgi:hypothetical protein